MPSGAANSASATLCDGCPEWALRFNGARAPVRATVLGMKRSAHPHFNPWLALVVVCFGQFMVVLDATIVNVALPAIQNDLGFSDSSLPWVVNAYTLLFGGFLLLGGRAADLLGRRSLFLAGVALFSAASLSNGLATSETQLIVGRAVQGLGGAMLSPAALSVITTSFGEGAARTKALSIWAGVAAGGGAVGLLLGGFLVESLSWEWIFFVNVPVGVAIIVAALKWVPNSRQEGAMRHFDLAGAATVTGGLIAIVYAIVESSTWGWGDPRQLGLAAFGIAPARRLRRDRAPLARAAGAARPLPAALAGDRQRRLPDGRRRPLRDVLLRLALPAESARLLAADHRARLPAGHRRDRDRRDDRRESDRPRRPAPGAPDRDAGRRGGPRGARRDDQGRRPLLRRARRPASRCRSGWGRPSSP